MGAFLPRHGGEPLPNFSGTPPLTLDSITHSACSSSIAPATAAIASVCVVAPGGVTTSSPSNLPHSPARFAVATVRCVDKEVQAYQHDIWSDIGLATGNSAIGLAPTRSMDASAVVSCLSRVAASQRYALSVPPLATVATTCAAVHQATSPHASLSVEQSPVRLSVMRGASTMSVNATGWTGIRIRALVIARPRSPCTDRHLCASAAVLLSTVLHCLRLLLCTSLPHFRRAALNVATLM